MKPQNYGNHVRMLPAFHYFLVPLCLITATASLVNLILSERTAMSIFGAILFVSFSLVMFMTILFTRRFACKVQDRAIRAEENLRHFALSGQRFDPRLTTEQIAALRFASDKEYLSLCEKAANESIPPDVLKRTIQTWRADYERV